MLDLRFHSCGRDRPKLGVEINLSPPCTDDLTRSRRRQYTEFKRAGRRPVLSPKLADERGNLGVRNGGEMLCLGDLGFRRQEFF